MAPISTALATLLLPLLASAHFTLDLPETIGFDEDKEATGPCGGFTPDFSSDNVTDFHVGGDAVALTLAHPQANWLFRGTLDQTGSSNWTQLFPIVQQSGIGAFCEPAITAPESWAGQKGIVGVVADAPDGLLYQCAAVSFVSGAGTTTSDCKNASVTASFVSDSSLAALVGEGADNSTTPSSSASGTASSSSSSSSASTSASGNAAAQLAAPMASGMVGSLLTAASMVLLGAAFVL
ncbi:Expression library immunization antigen 1 [Pleurostoma richardsiae]|uniref:Expression library immunization antigen 1 n=1 Tax=Pleurostoma richardsiae TaxID=41990 RepID=A0AA38R6V2_9PEZI|nr:Expression library immunization antigen 1 [Pleurostoma richardsiae]